MVTTENDTFTTHPLERVFAKLLSGQRAISWSVCPQTLRSDAGHIECHFRLIDIKDHVQTDLLTSHPHISTFLDNLHWHFLCRQIQWGWFWQCIPDSNTNNSIINNYYCHTYSPFDESYFDTSHLSPSFPLILNADNSNSGLHCDAGMSCSEWL